MDAEKMIEKMALSYTDGLIWEIDYRHDQQFFEAFKRAITEGFALGERSMRERAAREMDNVIDLHMDELVAAKRQIRALPLETGEGK